MKKALRKKYQLIRNSILDKETKDNYIMNQLLTDKNVLDSRLILIYVSTDSEINTKNIINKLLPIKEIAVPKIENNQMNFYKITALNELKKGYYDILEPISNNIVANFEKCVSITPGICFDKSLYRLGYGKGFYDKFYMQNKDIYKIGLCYDECLIDDICHDEFDIDMDEVITPTKKILKR